METIYDAMETFNKRLFKEIIYYNWEEVKDDLINFINSLYSVKKDCEVGECSEGFYVKYLNENEVDILTKEQFFDFIGRLLFELYIDEMIKFNCFAMDKIFGVSNYYKIK
ncbi:MAG: hypothetical protein IKG40_02000 [Bacilli bacterium]|nr:hypothetical protein [Bacilli bacterium]